MDNSKNFYGILGFTLIGTAFYMWGWHFLGGLSVLIAGCWCFTSDLEFDLKITKDKIKDKGGDDTLIKELMK